MAPYSINECLTRSWSRSLGSQPTGDLVINTAVGCYHFLPRLRSLLQPKSITTPWWVPNYTVRWQRHTGSSNLPKVTMLWRPTRTRTRNLWIASPMPDDRGSKCRCTRCWKYNILLLLMKEITTKTVTVAVDVTDAYLPMCRGSALIRTCLRLYDWSSLAATPNYQRSRNRSSSILATSKRHSVRTSSCFSSNSSSNNINNNCLLVELRLYSHLLHVSQSASSCVEV